MQLSHSHSSRFSMNFILNLSTELAPEQKIMIRKQATSILQNQGYSLTSAPITHIVNAFESVAQDLNLSRELIMISGFSYAG